MGYLTPVRKARVGYALGNAAVVAGVAQIAGVGVALIVGGVLLAGWALLLVDTGEGSP